MNKTGLKHHKKISTILALFLYTECDVCEKQTYVCRSQLREDACMQNPDTKEKNIFKRLFRSYESIEKADYAAETGESEESLRKERVWMELRNLFVIVAAVLFILSLLLSHKHTLRAIAYFLGAAAYISELAMLTKGFRERIPHAEAFMALCFGPLYILMGIAYLVE